MTGIKSKEKSIVWLMDVTSELRQENEISLEVIVGRKPCRFLIDSGANVSVIKKGISNKLIRPCSFGARGASGSKIRVYGTQKVSLSSMTFVYIMNFS